MRKFYFALVLIFCAVAGGMVWAALNRPESAATGVSRLAAQPADADLTGFERAAAPILFEFPNDHGAHPNFQTEWWYYTGNLTTVDGRQFGYQLTFFRRALLPASQMPERESRWAAGQVYMAHFALSEIDAGRFRAFERLARGVAGLAGTWPGLQASDPGRTFRVWLEDWQVIQTDEQAATCPRPEMPPCSYRLKAADGDVSIELNLFDTRGPVLQGDRGYSRKGGGAGQASYYYSLTRLQSSGVVTVDGKRYPASGWSWMDHEWSTSALATNQVGWDWFSIQMENGIDLMVFQIRREDGSIDPFSSGLLIYPDGRTLPLDKDAFTVEVTSSWKSPHSRAVYPAGWIVRIPDAGLTMEILPHMADQELNLSYAYWEGAVRVKAQFNGQAVFGNGYVELTGYSDSLGGEF